MSSDTTFKHARRRTNSTAIPVRTGHSRGYSRQIVQAKSDHTSDEFLKPFLSPSFDPAAFLNSNLPPLQRGGGGDPDGSSSGTAELSTRAQALISQLNAHTTRLSNTLTSLTDDVLRSGSRLAYEVELLRGETLSLTETMNETLREDIKLFVPEGLQADLGGVKKEVATPKLDGQEGEQTADDDSLVPAYVKQLQTLTLVRARLESVIKTFGDAMEFVFPPSELSVSSSFLSVSAPEPGSQQQSSEDKGQEVLRRLREEVAEILNKTPDPVDAIAKAAQRVEELKELTSVWKGTAEEKGRNKFIDGLAKMVEDKHKDLMREMELSAKREGKTSDTAAGASRPRKSSVTRDAAVGVEEAKALPGGFGLLTQLQKLRSGL